MKWQTALDFARNQEDVTYEEWCGLYVDNHQDPPNQGQIAHALQVAHPILVRNNVIEKSVVLSSGPF